jgi:3D (Asp-Asp-Asp) domain-containing protein
MPKEKRFVNRRRLKLARTFALIAGFVVFLHMAHRECSPLADSTMDQSIHGANTFSAVKDMKNFQATAYCVTGITKSGVPVAPGHVAADPRVIPLGSVIYVDSPLMGGIYQVLDTGELIKGQIIDIFIPSYEHCLEFGRRMVKVKVLRYGFMGDSAQKAKNN